MIETIGATQTAANIPFQARILNETEAALVWKLSWGGDPKHVIAAKLGTMPSKIDAILSEATHIGSKEQAIKMFPPDRN